MTAARATHALSGLRALYGVGPQERLEDVRRGIASLQRMVDEAERPVDLAALFDAVGRQAAGIAQAATRGAAAARAMDPAGGLK